MWPVRLHYIFPTLPHKRHDFQGKKITEHKMCFNFLYNDVSNQQDATSLSFINFFKSALHVSGDKLAHPQEHFLILYTDFRTMHRYCFRPVHCTKSCVWSQKVLLRMGELVARNM